jgi:hypothetical protein
MRTSISISIAATLAVVMLASAAIASASSSTTQPEYMPFTHGYVLKHCHHTVRSGSNIAIQPDGTAVVTHEKYTTKVLPKCDTNNGEWPMFVSELPSATKNSTSNVAGLPADYRGWLAYTQGERHNVSYNTFLGNFSVPDAPAEAPQVLYLFTGLQNINWIPKVMPEPSTPFDIIQPVSVVKL